MYGSVTTRLFISFTALAVFCASAATQPRPTDTRATRTARAQPPHLRSTPRRLSIVCSGAASSRGFDEQLYPERIEDSGRYGCTGRVSVWTLPVEQAQVRFAELVRVGAEPTLVAARNIRGGVALARRDRVRASNFAQFYLENIHLASCRLRRVEASEHQTVGVMTDFWENHFSVYAARMLSRSSFVAWDRAVIRPHALGRFRTCSGSVAHSPVMLNYLDKTM